MRAVDAEKIKETVKTLCLEACFDLPSDLLQALEKARGKEDTEIARSILSDLLENAGIAREERIPSCQDTGMVVVFVDMGEAVQVVNGGLREAVEAGVREAYEPKLLGSAGTVSPPASAASLGSPGTPDRPETTNGTQRRSADSPHRPPEPSPHACA